MNEKSVVQAVVRPKKVAVLIPFNMPDPDFREIIEFLGWLWGGKYSCIVPFDPADEDNELGMSWLALYSPDVVYCADGSCDKKWQKRIEDEVAPLGVIALRTPLDENLRYNFAHLISWDPVAESYAKQVHWKPGTRSRFLFASTEQGISNRIFYDLSFGVRNQEECKGQAEFMCAGYTHVEKDSVSKYVSLHSDTDSPFSYLDVSAQELSPVNMFGEPPTIFILSRSNPDYAWFWNQRFKFEGGSNSCIALPADILNDAELIPSLVSWLTSFRGWKSNHCKIKTISSERALLDSLARKLRPRLKQHGYEHVDVEMADKRFIPRVYLQHKRHDIDAVWLDENSFEVSALEPDFANSIKNDTDGWIMDLDGGRYLKNHIPPSLSPSTNIKLLNAPSPTAPLYSMGMYSKRYSYGDVSVACNKKERSKTITLPTADELLLPFFKSKGIREHVDEKRTCYEAAIELFGGLGQFIECCKEKRFDIIDALRTAKELPCEKNNLSLSKGCSIKQSDAPVPVLMSKIKQRAKLGKGMDEPFQDLYRYLFNQDPLIVKTAKARFVNDKGFYRQNNPRAFIAWMIQKEIVRQVLHHPKCSVCGNVADWSAQVDLAHSINCSRCGSRLPVQEGSFDIGYQLNPLVNKALKEGVLPVVLTLGLLKRATDGGFMYLPGFKGTHNGQGFDIDIVAVCDGDLVFCECKDMSGVPARSKAWGEIKEQFEALIEKGGLCGASAVVLASMADEYPKNIQKLARDKSTSRMRVVLLEKDQLLQGYVESKRKDMEDRPAGLYEAFLPQRPSRKSKRKGERKMVFGGMEVSK